jgi:NifU-like protein
MEPYSEKLQQLAKSPKQRGAIFQMEADDKGLALVESKVQSLKIYVLVDPDSDKVMEARFFTYGGPVFTALAEVFCTRVHGTVIDTFTLINPESLEMELRDAPDKPSMPLDTPEIEAVRVLIRELIRGYPDKKKVALGAREARNASHYRQHTAEGRSEADLEWFAIGEVEQIRRIETCLDEKVRQALHLDGGGMEVLGLQNGTRLTIRYSGACNGCGASSGGTLIFIENQLRECVYYNISVEPEAPSWATTPDSP